MTAQTLAITAGTVATRGTLNAAIAPSQTEWTPSQLTMLRAMGCEKASREEMAYYLAFCQRTGLDPIARQVYFIGRNTKVWDPRTRQESWITKHTIQVGLEGWRAIASRTGRYEGMTRTLWIDAEGKKWDSWAGKKVPPAACEVGVYVTGFREAVVAVAHWDEVAQTGKKGELTGLWGKGPAMMIEKCATVAALRKAFPLDFAGVYAPEEAAVMDLNVAAEAQFEAEAAAGSVEGMTDFDVQVEADNIDDLDELRALWNRAEAAGLLSEGSELRTHLTHRATEIQTGQMVDVPPAA